MKAILYSLLFFLFISFLLYFFLNYYLHFYDLISDAYSISKAKFLFLHKLQIEKNIDNIVLFALGEELQVCDYLPKKLLELSFVDRVFICDAMSKPLNLSLCEISTQIAHEEFREFVINEYSLCITYDTNFLYRLPAGYSKRLTLD